MRESPATTPAELDSYKVVFVTKGILQVRQVDWSSLHADMSFSNSAAFSSISLVRITFLLCACFIVFIFSTFNFCAIYGRKGLWRAILTALRES